MELTFQNTLQQMVENFNYQTYLTFMKLSHFCHPQVNHSMMARRKGTAGKPRPAQGLNDQ